ncbi:hypothetical protein GW796_07500 [archaeon]|nr:hypothetical protein [archaeon]
MSFNNVLPWWVYQLSYEHELAKMSCAFEEEWFSGTHKEMPNHMIATSKATFSTWNYGGWNYEYSKKEIEEIKNSTKKEKEQD